MAEYESLRTTFSTPVEVVSVNVGAPRVVEWRGRLVRTSIFKEPVSGPVAVRRLNVDGDEQSDLSVHGGPDKAIYAYRAEHYVDWRRELPDAELGWGAFGENLTIAGLPDEDEIFIGDVLHIGSAVVTVTQPRVPCFKLALRFQRPDMVKRFARSGRSGFYLSVRNEGTVEAGDDVVVVSQHTERLSVADVTRLYMSVVDDPEAMRRASELEALPASWRNWFRERAA